MKESQLQQYLINQRLSESLNCVQKYEISFSNNKKGYFNAHAPTLRLSVNLTINKEVFVFAKLDTKGHCPLCGKHCVCGQIWHIRSCRATAGKTFPLWQQLHRRCLCRCHKCNNSRCQTTLLLTLFYTLEYPCKRIDLWAETDHAQWRLCTVHHNRCG